MGSGAAGTGVSLHMGPWCVHDEDFRYEANVLGPLYLTFKTLDILQVQLHIGKGRRNRCLQRLNIE